MAERTTHSVLRMRGRDPHEEHRGATPLELLFDLTFVIAFGVAANELAHAIAEHHTREGLIGFGFAVFAVSWAWIFYSWFASAYDTDDWPFRLLTMLQMTGVLVLALGLPVMFESIAEGEHVDNGVMVLGYIVMRVPMLLQWLRASRQDPDRRPAHLVYMVSIVVSQVGWVLILFADLSIGAMFSAAALAVLVELSGPVIAESRRGGGTPWHAHHIAERYGLMVIIALGEGLLGTTAALATLVEDGWTVDVALLGLAGTALTFGVWWTYFVIPHGALLHAHRERSFGWGYGQIPLFGAVVAIGAGLHVGAYHLGDEFDVGRTDTVLAVAVPLAVYVALLYLLYAQLTRTTDPFHLLLIAGSAAVIAAGIAMAAADVDLVWCLLVLAFTPWVTVIGYEAVGHRHNEQVLESLSRGPRS
jgi:low temperature requirement protein LtrA